MLGFERWDADVEMFRFMVALVTAGISRLNTSIAIIADTESRRARRRSRCARLPPICLATLGRGK